MREITVRAKTVEEAVEIALKELDADRSDAEINVVNHGKTGILGIGANPAVVRVVVSDPPELSDTPESNEQPDDEQPDGVQVAIEVVESLLALMGVDVVYSMSQPHEPDDMDGPLFEIEGEDSGLLIGRRGETLRTLQFMARYIVSHRMDERVMLDIDVEGYQERRRMTLESMALRVADRVSNTGRAIPLEPMSPSDRRTVHIALSDHPSVITESEGSGDSRRVVIHMR